MRPLTYDLLVSFAVKCVHWGKDHWENKSSFVEGKVDLLLCFHAHLHMFGIWKLV